MKIEDEFLLLQECFQENICKSKLQHIRKEFSEFTGRRKNRILNLCDRILCHKDIALIRNQEIRVITIRVITAAFPDSIGQFEKLLKRNYTSNQYELLFTMFVYVSDLLNFPNSKELCKSVVSFVREFLLSVKYDTGMAAWKAGDLLGAHWNLSSSLPVLFEVARNGTYVAGRESALTGLEQALKRTKSSRNKKRIINLLHEIIENDKSKHVRFSAQWLLKKVG